MAVQPATGVASCWRAEIVAGQLTLSTARAEGADEGDEDQNEDQMSEGHRTQGPAAGFWTCQNGKNYAMNSI